VQLLPERTLILLDGFGYIFRAYYSRVNFTTRNGVPTGAFTIFGNMLMALLNTFGPRYFGVVFESRTGNVRTEILPELKANRTPPPEDLIVQIPLIEELIRDLGIPLVSTDGYEADDTIAALGKRWLSEQPDSHVIVLSTDKDLLALVSERLYVYDPMAQKLLKPEDVRVKWGVDPDQISDLLALTGDSVDNISGVPGIGPKTAAGLLAGGLHVEDLVSHVEKVFPERLRPKILEYRDLILRNKSVTILHDSFDVDASPGALSIGEARWEDLHRLASRLETAALLSRASEWIVRRTGKRPELTETTRNDALTPSLSDSLSGLPRRGLVWDEGTGSGLLEEGRWQWTRDEEQAREWIRRFLEDPEPYWVSSFTGLSRTFGSLSFDRLPVFDMELAGYLADPGHRDYRIPALMSRLFISGDLSDLEERGRILLAILGILRSKIQALSLGDLLSTVEIPVARILVSMERTGICVSRSRIGEVRRTIEDRLGGLEQHIYREAGGPFSVLSPKQVGSVLYEKLGLPVQKKGKTGYSTDEETLEALAELHPLPRLIIEYRQLRKFLSTYLGPMEEGIDAAGRLHGQFNQTVAATGRLSSSNPNLQNIPVKSDLGLLIRRCFVAPAGSVLLSADYSQIELRLLAHLSQDPFLLQSFASQKDIHAQTAEALFGSPVTPENRRRAKTLNFAILYGMSSYSLSQDLGLSQAEAQGIIDRYFQVFERVGPYFESIRREAQVSGRVGTILGRIRPIPEILSDNRKIREYGERMAVNSVLQGSAADLVKKAMVDLDRRLLRERSSSRLLIQVHDELLLEVDEEEEDATSRIVRESMEGAFSLSVPLLVSIGIGRDWVDAHPV
jgi:DNA polymerase-1